MSRIGLFALNGMGNFVLESVHPEWLVTRREPGPYPYFACEPIESIARRLSVPFWYSDDATKPPDDVDLILVATYHEVIKPAGIPAINLHPSIHRRGRNPMRRAIDDGMTTEGVTAHIMTGGFDDGPVVDSITVVASGLSEGELRQRLGQAMATVAERIVARWPTVKLRRNTLI